MPLEALCLKSTFQMIFTLAELLKSSMSVHTLKLYTWVITCGSFSIQISHMSYSQMKSDMLAFDIQLYIVFQTLDFAFGLADYPFENVSGHICEI